MAPSTSRPHRRGRPGVAVAAVVALPMVASVPAAATAASGTGTENARVCTDDMVEAVEVERGAVAGTTYLDLALVKLPDGEPCLMHPRADMFWVEAPDGARVGARARHVGEAGYPFLLADTEYANVTVAQPDTGNYDPEVCEPTEVSGMRLRPAEQTETGYLATEGVTACANPEVGVPLISPLTEGAG